ncbi:hypothetical protein AU476_03720 [Cupriavidus sp. UYMSc13B]|nr:hypothetical protein AU476_03720 [Cupriavidus sp. UYMSc13B]
MDATSQALPLEFSQLSIVVLRHCETVPDDFGFLVELDCSGAPLLGVLGFVSLAEPSSGDIFLIEACFPALPARSLLSDPFPLCTSDVVISLFWELPAIKPSALCIYVHTVYIVLTMLAGQLF